MKHKVEFANAGGPATTLVEITNELKIADDGWAQIAPLGDFPGMALVPDGNGGVKKEKAIQRIDRKAADAMAAEFKNSGLANRYLVGKKIFKGHPDVPGQEKRYPDKTPVGVFAELEARDNGFFGKPVFTNEGDEARKTLRALSGHWSAEQVGEENGVKIYSPSVLISAGLTDRPNLPVELLNEAESAAPEETPAERAEKLSKVAHDGSYAAYSASRKASLSNTAPDYTAAFHAHSDASKAHVEAANCWTGAKGVGAAEMHNDMAENHMGEAIKSARMARKCGADMSNDKAMAEAADKPERKTTAMFTNEITTLTTERDTHKTAAEKAATDMAALDQSLQAANQQVTTLSNEREVLKGTVTTITNERDLARTSFANERAAHIKTTLDFAIRGGRITFAERAQWEPRLQQPAQFENERAALLSGPSRLKIVSIVAERDGKKVELFTSKDRIEFQNDWIANAAKELKLDKNQNYDKLYAMFCNAHPEAVGMDPATVKNNGNGK